MSPKKEKYIKVDREATLALAVTSMQPVFDQARALPPIERRIVIQALIKTLPREQRIELAMSTWGCEEEPPCHP